MKITDALNVLGPGPWEAAGDGVLGTWWVRCPHSAPVLMGITEKEATALVAVLNFACEVAPLVEAVAAKARAHATATDSFSERETSDALFYAASALAAACKTQKGDAK